MKVFMTLLTDSYSLINNASTHAGNENLSLIFLESIWSFFWIISTLLILYACSAIRREARRTCRLLRHLQAACRGIPGAAEAVGTWCAHADTEAQRLGFYACGFFSVDLSLAPALAQGVATYVIVMVQFQPLGKTGGGVADGTTCTPDSVDGVSETIEKSTSAVSTLMN